MTDSAMGKAKFSGGGAKARMTRGGFKSSKRLKGGKMDHLSANLTYNRCQPFWLGFTLNAHNPK